MKPFADYSTYEIFSTFFEDGERGRLVAIKNLHRAYIDDTWDGLQEKYSIAAALLGTPKEWNNFSREWKRVRLLKPSIKWFHSKEWRGLNGEFLQFRDKQKYPEPEGFTASNAKRDSLRDVIEKSNVVGIAVAVLIEDLKLVRAAHPTAAELFREDPYEHALQQVVFETAKAVKRVDDNHCVGFIADDTEHADRYEMVYREFKKNNPIIAQNMRGLTHLDDKKWAGLQAADLIAHFANQVIKDLVKTPEDERTLVEDIPDLKKTFYRIAYVNKYYLCGALRDLTGLDIHERLGIKPTRYKTVEEIDNDKEAE